MGDILDMISRMNKRAAVEIFNIESEIKESVKCFKIFRDKTRNEIFEAQNNYNKPIFPNTPYKNGSNKRLVDTSSSDEEVNVSQTRVKLHDISEDVEKTSTKPKRGAAKAASENIKKVSNMKLNSKMRRPSHEQNTTEYNLNNVKIEKKSDSMLLEEPVKLTALSDVTNENMPPPTLKPKRGRKKVKKETLDSDTSVKNTGERVTRSTRSKIPNEPTNTNNSRRQDSDVLIQEIPITVVVVTDSESETDKSVKQSNEIETITNIESDKKKQKKMTKKETQNKLNQKIKVEKPSQDEVKNSTQNSLQEVSVYEDALSENNIQQQNKNLESIVSEKSVINSVLNETHIINKNDLSPAITNKIKETGVKLNCTVVLESIRSTFTINEINDENTLNETKNLSEQQIVPNSLISEDDDSIDVQVAVKTPNKKQPVKTKPIFSPYGNSPVKKRVAAFEKLGTNDMPVRVTRTKTRNLGAVDKDSPNSNEETPMNVNRVISATTSTKTKKYFTPTANNKLATMIPQMDSKTKGNKNTSVVSGDTSGKSLTVVKVSRAELQERREEEQKRKIEHENEVKRKKEAILQAKIEEQKRKREEKQMKAQKAREAKEKEKEEKIRRIIQEKEEKQQKEEQMKREWMNTMAKKAAEEEKRQQILKQEKLEQKRKLNKKPPPLPTDDLQDTDDEEENPKHKYIGPIWSQRQNLYPTLYMQRFIPSTIVKEFFKMEAQTPDLLEIFETVHADILRRNSSAVWRTPPRYSTLPKF